MNQWMRLRWVLGVGVLASAGCEVSIGECRRDDAGACVDLSPDYGYDGGGDMDGSTPPADAALGDAAPPASDASVLGDGGLDAMVHDATVGQPDTSVAALTPQQFCDAQLSVARAWLDQMDLECNCVSDDDLAGRADFLALALRYNDQAGVNCLDNVNRMTGVTYDWSKAAACATRYTAQFKGPDAFSAPVVSCPGGFDVGQLEAAVGHGAQNLAQLPECRAAFAGTKAMNQSCEDSLECAGGLRCITIPGGGDKTCQPARGTNAPCTNLSDCADGHVCSLNVPAAGNNPAGYACIPTDQLKLQGGRCRFSFECAEGLLCRDDVCSTAVADVICQ